MARKKKESVEVQWNGMPSDEATLKEIKVAVESTYDSYHTISRKCSTTFTSGRAFRRRCLIFWRRVITRVTLTRLFRVIRNYRKRTTP